MASYKKIGPLTIEVSPGRPAQGDRPAVSGIYRNIAAADGFVTDVRGSKTLFEIFEKSVKENGDHKCLGWRPVGADGKPGAFEWLTYAEARKRAHAFAGGLQAHGFSSQGKLGIYSGNNVEHMLALKALDAVSGVVVPIYDSLGDSAVEHILGHAEVEAILVEERKLSMLAKLTEAMRGQVKLVVVIAAPGAAAEDVPGAAEVAGAGIELATFEQLVREARDVELRPPAPSDLACIMYTSGTTGTPKGVVHTHESITAVVGALNVLIREAGITLGESDSTLSYLTLAHIFGRVVEELALSVGAHIGYWSGNIKGIMDDLAALRPTLFIAVPRVLERVASTVGKQVARSPLPARLVFNAAFQAKKLLLRAGLSQRAAGIGGDQLVFRKVRQAIGGRVRYIVSGGASLSPAVEDFANVALAPVLQGYGLTETCAASFIMTPGDTRLAYTVGPPVAANEFRLESVPELKYSAEDSPPKGEVCIRGPMLFQGYYKDEKKTKEDMDEDGFFHTGDIGTITPQGALKIIDRKKNIFKLAQGEYIAVEHLENVYNHVEELEQIWVHGESTESQLIAFVVPTKGFIEEHGGEGNLGSKETEKAMLELLKNAAKKHNLKGFEMIRAVHLDKEPWTPEDNLLTPSMKLKRPQLKEKYQSNIKKMYDELRKASN